MAKKKSDDELRAVEGPDEGQCGGRPLAERRQERRTTGRDAGRYHNQTDGGTAGGGCGRGLLYPGEYDQIAYAVPAGGRDTRQPGATVRRTQHPCR